MATPVVMDLRGDLLVALADAHELSRVGGKARPLAQAMAEGHLVPDGFVVIAGAAGEGRDAVAGAVEARLAELGPGPYAVRSSAVGEDGKERSFAGQLETMLSVEPEDVLDAVEHCWSSSSAVRALRYGGELGGVAVLVQRMLAPDAAGVVFSADPHSGERDVTLIEAVPTVGEQLMAGAVDPEAWRVGDGVGERVRELDAPVLTEAQAKRVAALAAAMAELFGAPQDVEWAICGDDLYLLQSRPITALPAEPVPIPIEVPDGGWQLDDHHGVLSPLGWDWIQPYPDEMAKAFGSCGAPIEAMRCTRIGGHMYTQMKMAGGDSQKLPPRWVLWLASRLAPSLRRANRTAEAFLDEEKFMDPLREWEEGGREELRRRTDGLFVEDPRSLDADELLDRIRRTLALTDEGLRKHAWLHAPQVFGVGELILFVEDELGWHWTRAMDMVTGSSDSTTELHRELEAIVLEYHDEVEDLVALPRSWSSLSRRCPALGQALNAWLGRNRLRMLHYEPKHPSIGERPEYVLSIVEGIILGLRSKEEPAPGRDHGAEALEEAAKVLSEEKLAEMRQRLAVAKRGYAARDENAIETLSRPTGLLRYFVLELGRRIEDAIGSREHAVFLYAEEHERALRGELQDIAAIIERRRGEESWALRNRGPRWYGPPKPPNPPADAFPRGMSRMMRIFGWVDQAHASPEPSEGDLLCGVGVGSRSVTGRARVIRRPEEMAQLRHGEIVVCRITSPECAVALGRVAAIVTNEGGMLSHPAIIAREFDVPAVVGVADATQRIATGDTIAVDPVASTVTVLS